MSPKIRRFLVFAIPVALVLGGGTAWYVKYKNDTKIYGSAISAELKAAAVDLVAAGIGNSFVNQPWFTKSDLHALSFYTVAEGQLRVILRNDSSDSFFTITSPKFMRDEGFKTFAEETEMCLLPANLRFSNTLVLASDKNLYLFDPFFGCTSRHTEYFKQLDAATEQLAYNYLLVHPEFDSSIRTQ
jgi:hypothetical protein